MDIVIAFAACSLLCVQIHRNYLMIQAAKKKPETDIVVNVIISKEEIDK